MPGVVDGWWSAHEYSRATMGSPLGWRDLLADAIVYAREGFSASDGQRTPPPREPDLFGPEASPEIRRDLWPLYHPDALARGPLIQTDLARTIEAVAAGGPEAFYRGDVARRIVAAAAAAGSPLAIEDFAEHRSEWVEPLTIRYGGGVAASFPRRPRACRRWRCWACPRPSTWRRCRRPTTCTSSSKRPSSPSPTATGT